MPLSFPAIPTEYIPQRNQALKSSTFQPPPLDGSLTIPELFDWHGEHSAKHALFEYIDDGENGNGTVRTITWGETVCAIRRASKLIGERVSSPGGSAVNVVAIVAAADTVTYLTTIVAVMRSFLTVFPISPRNSAAAVAHLLSKSSVVHILVGSDQKFIDLVKQALEMMQSDKDGDIQSRITTSTMPSYEDCFLKKGEPCLEEKKLLSLRADADDVGIILHSSGSTAFPKPIKWTHRILAQISLVPFFGERDLTGIRLSLQSIPMYHAMGIEQLCFVVTCGLIFTTFKPQTPAIVPTADLTFKYAQLTKSDFYFCVPSFLETWSQNPSYVKSMAESMGVIFGGSTLNKRIGDYLVSQGVTLINLYGSTEAGLVAPVLPNEVGKDWEYFRISGHVKPAFVLDQLGTGNTELLILTTPIHQPAVINAAHEGVEAYATSDFLQEHPTKKGYWRVLGRVDDQIIHSTGEKTNPTPLENILNQDPHILSSIIFGHNRIQTGVLIDPEPRFKFNSRDERKLVEFRNVIWSTVEQLNTFAPQHSRLFKEMILVANPSKPVTYTAKSTVRRRAVLQEYESEIDALYKSVEKSAQREIGSPETWDVESTLRFVQTVVEIVMKKSLDNDVDIFQNGCDSLQATWIRNTILRALRESPAKHVVAQNLPINFVYENPTIVKLAQFIASAPPGEHELTSASRVNSKIIEMAEMVQKYTAGLRRHDVPSLQPALSLHVFILTGSTGNLGCNLLVQLVRDPSVARIYALNRKADNGKSLEERQISTLTDQGFEPEIIQSHKVVFLESDLVRDDLGLHTDILNEMRRTVTHVIHNAWRVDFNLSLASFEPNIKGLHNLIKFALSSTLASPPTVLFTSSVGIFRNATGGKVYKEEPVEPGMAVGQGYSESKWVCERMLQDIIRETGLPAVIVRVGQLSGGINGSWNTNEWLPSIVKSAVYLKYLPDVKGDVSWIPVDVAAKAIVEIRMSKATYIHLVHPRPVKWSVVLDALSAHLKIPSTPYNEWLLSLEELNSQSEDQLSSSASGMIDSVPALRILDFFRRAKSYFGGTEYEVMGFPKLSTTVAQGHLKALSGSCLRQLDSEDVQRWLHYWKRTGYL